MSPRGRSDDLVAGESVGAGAAAGKKQRAHFAVVVSICLSGSVFLMVGGSHFWAKIQADDGSSRFAENLAWEWPRVIWYGAPWFMALSVGAFVAALMVGRRGKPFRGPTLALSVLAMIIAGASLAWAGATERTATIPNGETVHGAIQDIDLPAGGTRGATCCMFATTYYYPQNPDVLAGEISQIDGYRVTRDGDKYIGSVYVYISGDKFGSRLTLTYD